MKKFSKFIFKVLLLEVIIIVIANVLFYYISKKDEPFIVREENKSETIYTVTYNKDNDKYNLILLNCSLGIVALITLITYSYINNKIIKPFSDIKEMPYELAKGNLTKPLQKEKDNYFGKFTWGMDMLRENLEDKKRREIEYQKEKKTLILSLSHDIKTPLSAIKLYTKALEDNLYESEQRRKEVIEGIRNNTVEIEHYVNEIVKNSRDDFMDIPVNNIDFYLNEVINKISVYYNDKLSTIHTSFIIDDYINCLVIGDPERLVEVIQNIIENAIKYGDGKEIGISFSEEDDCKLISIHNTGCNLKEDELPHIFESFYRGSNVNNNEGSGLGLYICKQIMHKMNGEIFAEIKDNNFIITIVIKK